MNVNSTSLISNIPSLKVVDVKTGSVTAPYTTTYAEASVAVPHGMGTDEIIPIAQAKPFYSWGGSGDYVTAPFATNDGRQGFEVRWDATNVYLVGISSTGGSPQDPVTYNYTLFICVP